MEEETEREWRQDEKLTADSGLCDLRRLVPVCLCDGHPSVWLWGRPLDGCLRVSHPSVSCLLRYHQGTCLGGKGAALRMLANLGYRLYGVFPAKAWRFDPLTVVADISVLGREIGARSRSASATASANDRRQHIIRSTSKKPRLRSKLYLFNSFGMIGGSNNRHGLVHVLMASRGVLWCCRPQLHLVCRICCTSVLTLAGSDVFLPAGSLGSRTASVLLG